MRAQDKKDTQNIVIGRNPVSEAVRSGRVIDKMLVQNGAEGSVKKIVAMAKDAGVQVRFVEKAALDRLAPGRPHQGIVAYIAAHAYATVEDILKRAASTQTEPFVVLLDGLVDPHNVGAIIRSADGAGAHGVVIPSRRAVGLTEVVAKASAGAIEYVPVARAGNLSQTTDQLKQKGLWVTGLDMGGIPYEEADLSGPLALVVGGEGQGLSRLVSDKCDQIVSIPMKGRISSLNASNAAAIIMFEISRRRSLNEKANRRE